jgi:hypothetical protein
VTSEPPFQQMLHALRRFWWVAFLTVILAGVAFVFATYTVKLGLPPKLTARAQPSYSASTQLLITSKRDPYLSAANVNARIVKYPTSTTTASGSATAYTYDSSGGADGDLQRLVEIANDLPPRVTSDPVIQLRNKEFRRINGTVTANNPYAFSGAGGFNEGPLPYIQINGTAHSPQDALDITNETALAFQTWFTRQQAATGISVEDRVLVDQVNSADKAVPASGRKPILGIAAALLVLLGGTGLALALERLIPRRSTRAQRVAVPAEQERPLPAMPMPAREVVPTMTFDDTALGEKTKPVQRPRKGANNGTPRRRSPSKAPRVAPSSDDAN